MDDTGAERHLTDEEIFALAAPAAGEPEALPRHLAHCGACGRALLEWKTALHEVAEEDLGPVGRRSPEEWRAAEDATLSVIRRSGRRLSEHEHGVVWFRLDLDLGCESEVPELGDEPLGETAVGGEEVVVDSPAKHGHGRDHAGLRGEQQRLAGLTGVDGDVLRQHPLQEVLRVRPDDADEVAGSATDA